MLMLANARFAVENDLMRHDDWGFVALMLSPTPQVYKALLSGESVPLSALDQRWVERYGFRDDPPVDG